MTWRFLNTGFHSGRFNMEFDETLASQLKERIIPPTFRVYGWRPYAISLGFNQDSNDFEAAKTQSRGIDIVRRPTGGRAILHAHELTYSVVLPIDNSSPREIYRDINEGLLAGLRLLGISATLSAVDVNFRTQYQEPSSAPCFASSAKHEIQFEEKKIAGSAQRRYGDIILQHGSILLGPQHRRITEFIGPHIEDYRGLIEETLLHRTIDAETILGRDVSFEEAAECIKKGIEESFDMTFLEDFPITDNLVLEP